MKPLYTIGYQKLPLAQLVEIVRQLDALLVDCRLYPKSSWNLDYSRSNLENVFGQRYIWKGRVLGGFDHVTSEGIDWIKQEREKRPLLLMCMEHDPWECHRHHTICGPYFSDAIHIRGRDRILASDLKLPDSLS
ncbi:MAG TPA: DUF488 domain-containing protein [Blastocatellia bacterium]|nr:DUF488 domain-containing protein [Blastocatellia bacterium]